MKIHICLLIFLVIGCKNNNFSESLQEIKSKKNINDSLDKIFDTSLAKNSLVSKYEASNIIPDTSINKKLFLSDFQSLSNFYSTTKNIVTIERVRESPVVIFSNKNNKEYLIAYQYEGGMKNSFDCYEIGYLLNERELEKETFYNTSEDSFKTESNIYLGLPLENLISIKGASFKKNVVGTKTILTYRNCDFENSDFLQRYNMPSYFMEFTMQENRIIKIKFGFDYP